MWRKHSYMYLYTQNTTPITLHTIWSEQSEKEREKEKKQQRNVDIEINPIGDKRK